MYYVQNKISQWYNIRKRQTETGISEDRQQNKTIVTIDIQNTTMKAPVGVRNMKTTKQIGKFM